MSGIDRPGRWRMTGWSDDRWFDAKDHDYGRWRGVDESGLCYSWKDSINSWNYVGPLSDAPPAEISDEQKMQWFRELVQAGRVEVRLGEGWLQVNTDNIFRLKPEPQPPTTITLRGPAAAIEAAKQTPGVEVVGE